MLNWISSYTQGRIQYVKFKDEDSYKFEVTSGVPAGTHGGPDLFLVMINDLPDVLDHSEISRYADDCKIYREIKDDTDFKATSTSSTNGTIQMNFW